jgi:hypothetical protein
MTTDPLFHQFAYSARGKVKYFNAMNINDLLERTMSLIGKIICKLKGRHLRGKPIPGRPDGISDPHKTYFACPRCGRVTSYKVRTERPPALKVA